MTAARRRSINRLVSRIVAPEYRPAIALLVVLKNSTASAARAGEIIDGGS
jgi:hypothetical protein